MKYIFAILCFSFFSSCTFNHYGKPIDLATFKLPGSNAPLPYLNFSQIGKIDIGMTKEECNAILIRTYDDLIVRDLGSLENVEMQFYKKVITKEDRFNMMDYVVVTFHEDKVIYFGRPEDYKKSSNEDIYKIGDFIFEFICSKKVY